MIRGHALTAEPPNWLFHPCMFCGRKMDLLRCGKARSRWIATGRNRTRDLAIAVREALPLR